MYNFLRLAYKVFLTKKKFKIFDQNLSRVKYLMNFWGHNYPIIFLFLTLPPKLPPKKKKLKIWRGGAAGERESRMKQKSNLLEQHIQASICFAISIMHISHCRPPLKKKKKKNSQLLVSPISITSDKYSPQNFKWRT